MIDARKETASHGTPPDLLRCELAAVGYRQIAFYDLQENTYLAVFGPAPQPGIVRCEAPVFGQAQLNTQRAARRRSR